MTKIKVLIIDDSPFIIKAVTRALYTEKEKYEICGTAGDGRTGVEQFLATGPDVVIMDITMPVLDGMSASKEILGINPAAKIIILSSMGDDKLIAEARSLGVSEYLQKPFETQELIDTIQKLHDKG